MISIQKQIDAAFDKKVVKVLESAKKKVAFEIFGQLFQSTPVDTSRAKSNWWMDTQRSLGVRMADNGASAEAQALATISANIKIEQSIHITNNLPYIQRLNDGSSVQAPAGFVESAIQVGKARWKE